MGIAALVAIILIHVVAHEAAHALAMRKDGVRIITAGLGLPYPPVLRVSRWRGINWTVTPWLLGAFVEPDHHEYHQMEERTPYRRLAWHYNAGIIINVIGTFLAVAALVLLTGVPLLGLAFVALAAATWYWREYVAAYVCPALAPLMLVALIGTLAFNVYQGHSLGFFTELDTVAPRSMSATSLLGMFAVVGVAIAVLNLAPLYPADNARVVDLLLQKWFSKRVVQVYQVTGHIAMLVLLAAVLGSDAYSLIF